MEKFSCCHCATVNKTPPVATVLLSIKKTGEQEKQEKQEIMNSLAKNFALSAPLREFFTTHFLHVSRNTIDK